MVDSNPIIPEDHDPGVSLPLVLVDINGKAVGAALMNDKGFHKSIENKELWVVHPDTARLLPLEGDVSFKELSKKGAYYEAVVNTLAENMPAETAADTPVERSSHIPAGDNVLQDLFAVIEDRKKTLPEGSYTTHLFTKGLEKIKKKTGEETIELVLAQHRDDVVYEAADLIYHMLVLLAAQDIHIDAVLAELKKR